MVRAILESRKTQTRRVLREQPMMYVSPDVDGTFLFVNHGGVSNGSVQPVGHKWIRCPYGKPGDRLWVRETWGTYNGGGIIVCASEPHVVGKSDGIKGSVCLAVTHKAGKENNAWGMYGEPKWKSGRFMPRTASRITLEITNVRVERLWEITFSDIRAEGVGCPEHDFDSGFCASECYALRAASATGWDKINGKRKGCTWADNPWVWCISFRRVDAS